MNLIKAKIGLYIAGIIALVYLLFTFVTIVTVVVGGSSDNGGGLSNTKCITSTDSEDSEDSDSGASSGTSSGNASIDKFVKEHEDAYLKSWKVGGFLPSASIAQTVAETSFSYSVPSFADAHNMGGVKWSGKSSFIKTIELYGEDAVSSGGAGTSVGDGTGGSYVKFSTFDAGIVGKAEFMSRQTLYQKAINNTDGISTLHAIADGGWATDPNYKTVLESLYNSVGSKYKWLDEKAISEYGTNPVDLSKLGTSGVGPSDSDSDSDSSSKNDCSSGGSGSETDGTGKVPDDAKAWGYKPEDLPESLKAYYINPAENGLEYEGNGWVENSGQCVDLTVSLGNQLWKHSGTVFGNGWEQASAWAVIFNNSIKDTPKRGAIFSTDFAHNHTGIVCHVFEDGSILTVEQNTPISGIDKFGHANTWDFRIFSPDEQRSNGLVYAYPDDREPDIK